MATNKVTGFRYPRNLAKDIHGFVMSQLPAYESFLGGSYIRELPTIGDVDIILLHNQPDDVLAAFKQLPGVWKRFGMTGGIDLEIPRAFILQYELGGIKLPPTIQVDFWICKDKKNWGAYCMFCAGDQMINIAQRARASKQGYLLGFSLKKVVGTQRDKKGNLVPAYGPEIDCPTEQDVYKELGWDWLPYRSRSILKK